MGVRAWIDRTYFDKASLTEDDYEKSRRLFLFEGSSAMGIFALTTGAFLAGYASFLGADDEFNGIIGAIPVFVGVVQIFASVVFENMEQRKFLVTILAFFHRMLLGLMFFIPLLVPHAGLRLIALAAVLGMANGLSSFTAAPAGNWIVDLIPEYIRGEYLAKKDAYSLATITIVSLVMGRVLDVFRDRGFEYGGFLVVGLAVFALAVMNAYCLSNIKEPPVHKNEVPVRLKNVLIEPLKNPGFRKIILLFIIWNISLQIAGPFFSVYMVTGLRLDYTYIMAIGLISSITRVFIAKYWGRLADRKSWFFSTKLSIGVLGICHLLWFFANPDTALFVLPVLQFISGVAWAGAGISLFNIQFIFAPRQGRTMYLGANAAYGGLIGFGSTLVGSFLVGFLKQFDLSIGGFTISNMQILFALSGTLLLGCAVFVHYFIKDTLANS